jgi:hypothetical protein
VTHLASKQGRVLCGVAVRRYLKGSVVDLGWQLSDLCSPEYREVLLEYRRIRPGWGKNGHFQIDKFIEFYRALGCGNILDYGSGAETLFDVLSRWSPPILVTCYDPGVPGREILPEPADFVVCTDVLEHIERDRIDAVIRHLDKCTRLGAYLTIGITKAKAMLPDGRNAHLIVEDYKWWLDRLVRDRRKWRLAFYKRENKLLLVWMFKAKPTSNLLEAWVRSNDIQRINL